TSLDKIDELIDNIYGQLANLDGQLGNLAQTDLGTRNPITQRVNMRVGSQDIYRLSPEYTQLAPTTTTTPFVPIIGTFQLSPETQNQLQQVRQAIATEEPLLTGEPLQPPPGVTLDPAITTQLNLAYTADQLLLTQQENELLLAILNTLQDAITRQANQTIIKEFPGFTPTGLRRTLNHSDAGSIQQQIYRTSPIITYPFVIRDVWVNGCTTAGGRTTVKIGYGKTLQTGTDIPNQNAASFITHVGNQNSIAVPSGSTLHLKPNWILPDAGYSIHTLTGNGTAVFNFMSVVFLIEQLIPDAETISIQ
ncbi:MAG: hypothetical protein WBC70_17295, partial [Candidatus Aminicenantales bacterium]